VIEHTCLVSRFSEENRWQKYDIKFAELLIVLVCKMMKTATKFLVKLCLILYFTMHMSVK